jgi:hypothetical protein
MDEKQQSYEWIATSCFIIGGIYLVVGSMSGSHFLWQAVGFYIVGMTSWPFRLNAD